MSHGQVHFFSSATVLRSAFGLMVLVRAFGGHHAGEAATVIRTVLGVGGIAKATMPSDDPGAVAGDELAKVLAWADAFDRAHPPKSAKTVKEKPHAH